MAEITGIIQELRTRDVSGGKKAYNIVVGGQEYGCGLYAPKAKVGDYVKFELDESRGYKNVGRNSLKVSTHKPPAEAIAEASNTKPVASTAGGTVDMKQEVVSRQSALNSAIAFMAILQSADALGLPASNTKGKRQEVLEAMLNQYMVEFFERNTGTAYRDLSPKKKDPEVADEAADTGGEVEPADDQWQ